MPPIFPSLPQKLGDYTLHHLHGSQAYSDFYEARQEHVERHVIIELIDTALSPTPQEQIIATARARASQQILGTMPVFEAKAEGNYFYIAQERPAGQSLEQLRQQGQQLSVLSLCRLLEKVSDLYNCCDIERINTTALTGNMIYIVDENNIRFLSPAQASELSRESDKEKMLILAQSLQALLPLGVPGATRIQSLVSWLRDGFEGQQLSWSSIGSTARLIIEQLHPELLEDQEELKRYKLRPARSKKSIFANPIFLGIASFLTAGGLAMAYNSLNTPINASSTNYQTAQVQLSVSNNPVTVEEYQAHLNQLATLSAGELALLHKDIPQTQRDHTPGHWDEQVLCLNNKKACTTPVHSVSYWDAIVYARLHKQSLANGTTLKQLASDGIALLTEEWSADSQDYPLYGKSYFIINNSGQLNREFNPNTRSPQRGFRTQQSTKKPASV